MQTSLASPVSQWWWTIWAFPRMRLCSGTWSGVTTARPTDSRVWADVWFRTDIGPTPLQTQMAGRVAGIWRDLHRLSCRILRSGERRRGCFCTHASGGMLGTKLSSLAIFLLLLHSAQAYDGKAKSHLAYTSVLKYCISHASQRFSSRQWGEQWFCKKKRKKKKPQACT